MLQHGRRPPAAQRASCGVQRRRQHAAAERRGRGCVRTSCHLQTARVITSRAVCAELLVILRFRQLVKVSSIALKAPADKGPSSVKARNALGSRCRRPPRLGRAPECCAPRAHRCSATPSAWVLTPRRRSRRRRPCRSMPRSSPQATSSICASCCSRKSRRWPCSSLRTTKVWLRLTACGSLPASPFRVAQAVSLHASSGWRCMA